MVTTRLVTRSARRGGGSNDKKIEIQKLKLKQAQKIHQRLRERVRQSLWVPALQIDELRMKLEMSDDLM